MTTSAVELWPAVEFWTATGHTDVRITVEAEPATVFWTTGSLPLVDIRPNDIAQSMGFRIVEVQRAGVMQFEGEATLVRLHTWRPTESVTVKVKRKTSQREAEGLGGTTA